MYNMIDLTKLPPADAERIAYAEGFTGVGDLFARISDLEFAAECLVAALEGDLDADVISAYTKDLRELLP
jgi:hypothetical protein